MLTGKAGLITGAARGIGRATAMRMAEHGATILVTDIDKDGSEQTCRLIREAGGEASYTYCDVTSPGDVAELVRHAAGLFGRLDFAVNNAGVEGAQAPIQDYPEDGYDAVMAVNLKGVFLCLRAETRQMIEQGFGSVVNTASMVGHIGIAGFSGYVASKHGVMGLTRAAALDVGKYGVRVNAVSPGFTLTEMSGRTIAVPGSDAHQAVADRIPLGRWGRPDEVGEAVSWLCSDLSSMVTGHGLAVDGGFMVA